MQSSLQSLIWFWTSLKNYEWFGYNKRIKGFPLCVLLFQRTRDRNADLKVCLYSTDEPNRQSPGSVHNKSTDTWMYLIWIAYCYFDFICSHGLNPCDAIRPKYGNGNECTTGREQIKWSNRITILLVANRQTTMQRSFANKLRISYKYGFHSPSHFSPFP